MNETVAEAQNIIIDSSFDQPTADEVVNAPVSNISSSTQTELSYRNAKCQASFKEDKPAVRCVRLQCNFPKTTKHTLTQTDIVSTCSVSIQCDLLKSIHSYDKSSDDEKYFDNIDKDLTYITPNKQADNDSDVEELCSSAQKKGKTVKTNESMTERKYIVYESMLLAIV